MPASFFCRGSQACNLRSACNKVKKSWSFQYDWGWDGVAYLFLAGISLFVSCFSSSLDTQDESVSVGDLKSFSFGTCCKLWKICWKQTCLPETCNLLSSQVTFRFDENWLLPSFLVEVNEVPACLICMQVVLEIYKEY